MIIVISMIKSENGSIEAFHIFLDLQMKCNYPYYVERIRDILVHILEKQYFGAGHLNHKFPMFLHPLTVQCHSGYSTLTRIACSHTIT